MVNVGLFFGFPVAFGVRTIHSVTCTPLHSKSMDTHFKYSGLYGVIVHVYVGFSGDENAVLCDETHNLAQRKLVSIVPRA